jgi:hypothetical protein
MAAAIRLNELITFGKAGRIKELDPFGFDLSEAGICWTQEEVAGFTVQLNAPPAEAQLKIILNVTPFTKDGQVSQQQLFIFINGLFVGFRTILSSEKLEFPLPRNVLSPRGMRVEFAIPTASSPKALGLSQDIRKLGVAISEFSIKDQK